MDSSNQNDPFISEIETDSFCAKIDMNRDAIKSLQLSAYSKYGECSNELIRRERKCEEAVSLLQRNILSLQQHRDELQNEQTNIQTYEAELSEKLQKLKSILAQTEEEKVFAEEEASDVKRQVSLQQKVLDGIISENKSLIATAEQGVNLYKRHLGLDIRKGDSPDSTVFSFTQIKPHDPERVFEVTVTLQGEEYQVTSDPSIEDITSIQDILNKSNNFTGFLLHMRNIFIKMA